MPRSTLGLIIGLVLGYAAVFRGLGDMLIVALVAAIGFLVGKALDGDLDLAQISDSLGDATRRR